jgi:hypothetical protein
MREIQAQEVVAVSGGVAIPDGTYVARPPILWLPAPVPPGGPVPL